MARRLRIGAFGMSRRDFLKGAAGVAAVWGTGCQVAKPHMNFYNWSLYIGPDTLSDFEKATGVLVNYDEFSSADVLYAKIKIGVTGYDLVVAPGFMVQRLRRQKLLFPLPSKAPREALHLEIAP